MAIQLSHSDTTETVSASSCDFGNRLLAMKVEDVGQVSIALGSKVGPAVDPFMIGPVQSFAFRSSLERDAAVA